MLYPRQADHPRSSILPDSQSNVDLFSNCNLLTNINSAKQYQLLHCDAGKAVVTQKGVLRSYGTIWCQPEGITSILSLCNVQKKHNKTYASSMKNVQKADDTNCIRSKKRCSSLILRMMWQTF